MHMFINFGPSPNGKATDSDSVISRFESLWPSTGALGNESIFFLKKRKAEVMYKFQSRVRYSETNKEGYMTLEAILDYFQDCTTFHSEDIGLGIDYLSSVNKVWVLSSWQIEVLRYPRFYEMIKIGTAPYDFKSFLGYRNFLLETEEGEILARANSIWTLMDLEKGRPAVPTPEMVAGYVLKEKLEMDYAPRKIVLPKETAEEVEKERIVIKNHHLDTNQHVNNGQYVRMAIDCLDEPMDIRHFRAEYKKSAMLDDVLVPVLLKGADKHIVVLKDLNDANVAVVEFGC